MNKLALLVLCAQALLVQNAYGQALLQNFNQGCGCGGYASSGYGNNLVNVASNVGSYGTTLGNYGGFGGEGVGQLGIVSNAGNYGAISGNNGGFGGNGVGQLGIVGELPIAGSTYVDGNLPVMGVVEFNGALPALGFVTVAGSTPCQCGGYSTCY